MPRRPPGPSRDPPEPPRTGIYLKSRVYINKNSKKANMQDSNTTIHNANAAIPTGNGASAKAPESR